jgi:Sulfotransferase family
LDAYGDVCEAMYRALAKHVGARVIVDSSKQPVHAALVSRLPGLAPRFVHVVRDPRAVAYSWKRGQHDPGRGPDGRMWRRPPGAAARAWVLANEASSRVRRHLPSGRSILLRYETLMADPADSLRDVLALVNDEAASLPFIGARTARIRPGHPVAGNPARFLVGPVELREDDEWRRHQSPQDRLLVTALTLPFLHRYGYGVRVGCPGRPRGGGDR